MVEQTVREEVHQRYDACLAGGRILENARKGKEGKGELPVFGCMDHFGAYGKVERYSAK